MSQNRQQSQKPRKPSPRAGIDYVRIKTRIGDFRERTDEEIDALVALAMPEACPGAFRQEVPCLECPARFDCDEQGQPPKVRVEHI